MRSSHVRWLTHAVLGAGLAWLGVTPALAQTTATDPATIQSCQYTTDSTHSYPFCITGQATPITVPSNGAVNYQFSYPGNNSDITFTAQLPDVNPTNATAIGFNVFDTTQQSSNPPAPVETATVLTDQLNSDPHSVQFNYSSGTAGPVTVQLFNYTPQATTVSLNDSGLTLGSANQAPSVTAVTLQLISGAKPAPVAAGAPAGPGQSTPAAPANPNGNPTTIASCQYTTDTTHSYPFCSTGQFTNVTVPSNGTVSYKLNYPGDNSTLTVTAQIPGADPTNGTAMGFNVYDNTAQANNPPSPVETATIQSNELNSDPHSIQFNYSSGTAGPVTLQLFNYTSKPQVISFNDSGLTVAGSATAPPSTTAVTLQLS